MAFERKKRVYSCMRRCSESYFDVCTNIKPQKKRKFDSTAKKNTLNSLPALKRNGLKNWLLWCLTKIKVELHNQRGFEMNWKFSQALNKH